MDFKKKMGGYDCAEVDDYIDDLIKECMNCSVRIQKSKGKEASVEMLCTVYKMIKERKNLRVNRIGGGYEQWQVDSYIKTFEHEVECISLKIGREARQQKKAALRQAESQPEEVIFRKATKERK